LTFGRALSQLRRPRLWAPALVVVAVGAVILGWQGGGSSLPAWQLGAVATVVRGTLVVSLTEAGEIEAEKSKVISNEISWPVVIKEIVEDGTMVKPGQTIVQFECKELLDAIAQQQLDVTAAENRYIQASQDLKMRIKELANNVEKAQQDLLAARENLRKYEEGVWPTQLGDAESDIKQAEGNLALAKDRLEFKLKANEDPELNSPYSENEIRSDKLELERLEQKLEKAKSNLRMLKEYTHPQELRRLKWAVVEAEAALERAKMEQQTGRLVAEANEKSKKRELDMRKARLEELLEEQKKLTIKADKEGLVVYDTGRRNRWSTNDIVVAVGEKIARRQQIMIIPDMSTLQVSTKVYEAVVDQVYEGIPAYIRLDAKPDLLLTGKVAKVSTLPDSQNRWLNPGVKVFEVIVKFDPGQNLEGLKPGMTAQVELTLAKLDNVLRVPIAAVFSEQDQTYCWRIDNDGLPHKVPVKVGRMNDAYVQILSGLSEGDRVLLTEPQMQGPAQAMPGGGIMGGAGG